MFFLDTNTCIYFLKTLFCRQKSGSKAVNTPVFNINFICFQSVNLVRQEISFNKNLELTELTFICVGLRLIIKS